MCITGCHSVAYVKLHLYWWSRVSLAHCVKCIFYYGHDTHMTNVPSPLCFEVLLNAQQLEPLRKRLTGCQRWTEEQENDATNSGSPTLDNSGSGRVSSWICSSRVTLWCQCEAKWGVSHQELRQVWSEKGVQPRTREVDQVKLLMCVNCRHDTMLNLQVWPSVLTTQNLLHHFEY